MFGFLLVHLLVSLLEIKNIDVFLLHVLFPFWIYRIKASRVCCR